MPRDFIRALGLVKEAAAIANLELGLLDEDRVRRILQVREQGRFLCDDTGADPDRCVTPSSVDIESGVYPPTRLPGAASVFRVTAEARVANVRRTVLPIASCSL